MIDFYHASMRRLDSGLYVAYLKMQNSVDCVRVMVNRYMPGSLPCTKIRSIANVSRFDSILFSMLIDEEKRIVVETNGNGYIRIPQ